MLLIKQSSKFYRLKKIINNQNLLLRKYKKGFFFAALDAGLMGYDVCRLSPSL
jgi:hypothetical protein